MWIKTPQSYDEIRQAMDQERTAILYFPPRSRMLISLFHTNDIGKLCHANNLGNRYDDVDLENYSLDSFLIVTNP